MAQTIVGRLEEHNQQIQALSPTEESLSQVPDDSALPVTTFLSLSIFIFFFVVVFLGFLPLVIERFRDFKRFQMALLVAFVAGAIPLTMGMVLQRSGVLTKASVLETPQDVQVSGISTESFRVTWETTDTQYGALRYGNEPFSEALEQTALEVGGLQRTNEHSVVVKNLEPDTDYYFELLSGAHWFDQGGVLLSVHTLAD
ncbi:MAG: hypothetical protein A3A65_01255 [Candidatus Chisholmbacteria bacterium RIFCSPLOWO2_01_FULL_49_14]|uniref:Fibronectin type-III domain-containing protein n=1 Tax=Candidatus Chisholmbacteria bacterium RIFCSPLOWO2_01_FULL_49_14 TaxID=1797593 RepID=A0A1G1VZM2_9BACT|nr:MAG: hypothetical protein A3A65_01255 [Candidatus Chisholmbacteria bacterium RIFCSPLOWO2_01_FULL_49_14]